ncbi:MAG: DNA cytosine methyltransferase [Gammaproteobacteria bacterium]|nr:DNA cytosine methyltransferase [Gammaproteobacteria bacterium]MYJ51145.1 DNA cytosine methyltransferase [Gammaproteobacteria bacterium]
MPVPAVALHQQTYCLGELFAGAGGMALGASQAEFDGNGFSHVWINDIDKDACKTFAHNLHIDETGVFCCDASKMNFNRLPPIDGLVFGFPCNDFSVVGEKLGMAGQFGGLYQWGVRALRAQKPLFFVAENVGGLATSGNAMEIITTALRRSGYEVSKQLYRFEEYGVPQSRHRIVFIGFRNDLRISYEHPEPTTKDNPVSSSAALDGIPSDANNNELTNQSQIVIERLKHIRPGENVFTAKLPDHLQLNMKSNAKISQIYRRLNPDKPSYTVTGSGGGGTHIYHWKEHRALTNRERARLQSFPDSFEFLGGKESVRRQIGMAVPPKGARVIFESVLKVLVERGIGSQC